MEAIVIRMRFDEGTESAEVAMSEEYCKLYYLVFSLFFVHETGIKSFKRQKIHRRIWQLIVLV